MIQNRLFLSLLFNVIVLLSPYRTLTAPVDFKECIIAIRDNAFSASMYPVIITLEDHLPKSLQSEASTVCPFICFQKFAFFQCFSIVSPLLLHIS